MTCRVRALREADGAKPIVQTVTPGLRIVYAF